MYVFIRLHRVVYQIIPENLVEILARVQKQDHEERFNFLKNGNIPYYV